MNAANSPSQALSPQGQATQLQLHDIHLPEQVSNFPIAPGWWILLATIIAFTIWLYKKHQKNRLLNASKNQALAMLEKNSSMSINECISLLKWAAMQYLTREQLAKLYGDALQAFLLAKLPKQHQEAFKDLSTAAFQSQYQVQALASDEIRNNCQQATKLWLTHALPVNNLATNTKELA